MQQLLCCEGDQISSYCRYTGIWWLVKGTKIWLYADALDFIDARRHDIFPVDARHHAKNVGRHQTPTLKTLPKSIWKHFWSMGDYIWAFFGGGGGGLRKHFLILRGWGLRNVGIKFHDWNFMFKLSYFLSKFSVHSWPVFLIRIVRLWWVFRMQTNKQYTLFLVFLFTPYWIIYNFMFTFNFLHFHDI